eukprot:CAMPEP_0114553734 /NCGR_PEP_ID=MMETSP0114-20121206/7829_1 /TAXON_ID=31324 /ORGANISM="Goniomonas sp, Strain m" /LENGTH=85 /DNA_ID=CAMNT_0001738723 /DNA_START=596 /DNA_END=849 /DNA_ORIENTATION=-
MREHSPSEAVAGGPVARARDNPEALQGVTLVVEDNLPEVDTLRPDWAVAVGSHVVEYILVLVDSSRHAPLVPGVAAAWRSTGLSL